MRGKRERPILDDALTSPRSRQCTPEHKGNTRLGKQERRVLEAMGFKKDWTGKSYQLWNAGGYAGQSMDVKEAACDAYASVLNSYGVKAHACSRAD